MSARSQHAGTLQVDEFITVALDVNGQTSSDSGVTLKANMHFKTIHKMQTVTNNKQMNRLLLHLFVRQMRPSQMQINRRYY